MEHLGRSETSDPAYIILDDVGEYLETIQQADHNAHLNAARLAEQEQTGGDVGQKGGQQFDMMEEGGSHMEKGSSVSSSEGRSEDSSAPSIQAEGKAVGGPTSPEGADQPKKSKGSARELKSLMSDSKKSRELRALFQPDTKKKWTEMDPEDSQKLLTTSLDAVLTALKDYTEHSYPFMQRVKRSEAPGYYDVVKNPMDLGTMHKKLQKGAYQSKQEFQDDLNLIFGNCRMYNTDPSGRIFLRHADAMEKKAKELMKNVQNIDLKKVKDGKEKATEAASPVAGSPARETAAKKGKGRKREREEGDEDEEPKEKSVKTGEESGKKEGKEEEEEEGQKEGEEEGAEEEEEQQEEAPGSNVSSPVDGKFVLSKEDVLQFWNYRHSQRALPFSRRTALQRDPIAMATFLQKDSLPVDEPMQIESTTSVKHEKERDKDKDKEKEIGFLPEYSHFMACVPSPIVFPSSFLSVSSKPQSDDQNEPLLSAEEANARLRQCVATLAQQAGFEAVDEHALDVLHEVAITYSTNVAHSLLNAEHRPLATTIPASETGLLSSFLPASPARQRQSEIIAVLEKLHSYVLLPDENPSTSSSVASSSSSSLPSTTSGSSIAGLIPILPLTSSAPHVQTPVS